MEQTKNITDKDIQSLVGNLLRVGVYISMAIVILGGVIYLFDHGSEKIDYAVFDIDKVSLKTVAAIFEEVITFKGVAIVQFGLLMLIFTPIARVIMAVVSFFIEKDYLYVLIGLIVLSIIMASLSGGFAH
ncbi:DUF1634 domain-containing protein [Pedobacter chitinilyticus]|uniref:DUF1634 domain-containing protein n=1 Tax=Pedobacter chitinilyticus TaxID=2233776 RepID=A0A443YIS8_9SPHI|nr:DUF1634 domain-containing protein [Pedobacter chitinilyticus]RWU03653.1 DUF1634 domain-containing protein [Pedobacter chitinilyticus]